MNALNLPAGVLLNLQVLRRSQWASHPGQGIGLFELKFAQISRSLEPAAVIRNVNAAHGPNATGYRLGMQFQEISEQDALFVMGFVYEQLSVARGVTHPPATA